jgi:4-hydroxy-2-oxoheptanedioate aldolase
MGDRVGVEAFCRSGADFVGIDAQHGFFGFEQAAVALQVANLCSVKALVRVPADQLSWVPRYIDAGADGVVVAMVSAPEEAERAVRLSRYQPHGDRSYGGGKRNGVGQRPRQSLEDEVAEVYAMVETTAALKHLSELAEVPGLSGLYVGPVDLGLALARPYPLPADDALWREAIASVASACKKNGIRAGMFATDGEDARTWLAEGFSDIVLSSDIALLRRSFHEHLARALQPVSEKDPAQPPQAAGPYAGR